MAVVTWDRVRKVLWTSEKHLEKFMNVLISNIYQFIYYVEVQHVFSLGTTLGTPTVDIHIKSPLLVSIFHILKIDSSS
jgi:hypothetical protein